MPHQGSVGQAGDLEFVQKGHVQLALVAEVEIRLWVVVGPDQRRGGVPAGLLSMASQRTSMMGRSSSHRIIGILEPGH